jgi:hypothetical protein
VSDVWGRSIDAGDYDWDQETDFDRISDINYPDNWEQYIKDLYRTGNTETLSALGHITDSGQALGIKPYVLPPAGRAEFLRSGENPIDIFSNQYSTVRTEGTGYAQDLISMVQENPELLNDPQIASAVEAMMTEDSSIRRFGGPTATGLEGVRI